MAFMNKRTVAVLKLPVLQNLIKRDPMAYRDEFLMQQRHFESELEIFKLRPTQDSERFTDLISFMSHVISYYPEETKNVPRALLEILEHNGSTVHPDVRAKLLQSLILLRNRNILDPLVLIKLSFKLFSIPDKALRVTLGDYIFNDIKAINTHKRNDKLNKGVQSILFAIVKEDTSITARKTVEILSELYRRRVWTDSRTINVIASACLSPSTRVMITAINFFLGIENKMYDDDEEEKKGAVNTVDYHEHSKKTKKRQRDVKRQIESNSKLKREQVEKVRDAVPLFPAIQLINDPQALAEKLFKKLRQSGERFEVKLLIMNFISRLIGCHRLILLSFYSFLQRYLTSHQKDVTHILAYLIQACHELTPPEDLIPVVKTIAYNFITERCTNEVVAVGINSAREIISRVPYLLREPEMEPLIQDLSMYSKKMHKSVTVSARGLINTVRELYPTLLRKGDRGKFHNIGNIPAEYGHEKVSSGVEGIELLEAYERGEIKIANDEVIFDAEDSDNQSDEDDEDDEDADELDGSDDEEVEDDVDGEEDEDEDDEEEIEVEGDEEEDQSDDEGSDDQSIEVEDEEEDEDDEDEEEGDEEDDFEDMDDDDDEDDDGEEDSDNDDEDGDSKMSADDTANAPMVRVKRKLKSRLERKDNSEANTSTLQPKTTYNKDAQVNRVDARRILSPDDFALLDRLKAAQRERSVDPRFRTKKHLSSATASVPVPAETPENEIPDKDAPTLEFAVEPESLGPGMKTGKTSKIDRITKVLQGRKEDKWVHEGHRGGLTNTEQKRKKNYVMVRRGKKDVLNKMRTSSSDLRYKKNTRKDPIGRDRRKRRRT